MSEFRATANMLTTDTAPAAEPVTLAEAKLNSRIPFSAEDALISARITAVREWMERQLDIAMVQRTYTANLPGFFDVIELPHKPLASVTAVKYYATTSPSVITTLADSSSSPQESSEVYHVDTGQGCLYRAHGESWPGAIFRHDAVQITFVAGYAPAGSPIDHAANVPEALKAALLLLVGDLFENREATSELNIHELPTAQRLMQSYRVY